MNEIDWKSLELWQKKNLQNSLSTRRITRNDIDGILNDLPESFKVERIGESFEHRPIEKIVFGKGPIKVLLWTQMHGNESTGTKALFDLIRWFQMPGDWTGLANGILDNCKICAIPILNPDGAEAYTRVNAQNIDLNRDVIDKNAPESILLQRELLAFDPDYCFNLHDQRNIFSVGSPPKAATISFLAPSVNQERSVTELRIKTMRVILSMNKVLETLIPGHIGRYTDEFYPTATGDNFQKMGYSTVLIESGHSVGDLTRKTSRRMTFISLISGLLSMIDANKGLNSKEYFDIPNNDKYYLDVIVRSVHIKGLKTDLGILLKDGLVDEKVTFNAVLDKSEDLSKYGADCFVDGSNLQFDSVEAAKKWVDIEYN